MKIGSTSINDVKKGSTQINKVYNGSTLIWEKYVAPPPPPVQTVYTSLGDGTYTTPTGATRLLYLVVAGGGGSGGSSDYYTGGGGAGGLLCGIINSPSSSYSYRVGDGSQAKNYDTSYFGNIICYGGGAGNSDTKDGGSGGGGSCSNGSGAGGIGVTGQGKNGASGYFYDYTEIRGGGAGGAGSNGSNGLGGDGLSGVTIGSTYYGFRETFGDYGEYINGERWFAGGGSGSKREGDTYTPGKGGAGIGGTGSPGRSGTDGAPNTGGGGGGRWITGTVTRGGSGIVIIKAFFD